ncbi:MAG TPA: protease modulator HflC [Planctomycetota bacterium]|nr:protease modulator HflC [Planctomycetota bacterium]
MRKATLGIVAVVVVILLIVVFSGLYTVTEMEYAVITQFGKPVRTVTEAGLAWKTPIVQEVNRIEKRILAWDGDPNDVITQDKKNIFIDTWARWRVVEPRQFYVSLGGHIANGQKKLDDIVDGVVRDIIAKYELNELVRSTNREMTYVEAEAVDTGQRTRPPDVKVGREKIELEILQRADQELEQDFGIKLLNVRIKRVNYVPAVRPSIYARMQAERSRISSKFESEAEEQKQIILGDMAKELAAIEGEGKKRTSEIRGEADAQATQIYADAIRQARELYEFQRILEAYEKVFDRNTLIILSTDSKLLRLLKEDVGSGRD